MMNDGMGYVMTSREAERETMNETGLDTLIENLTRAVYQHAAHNSVINQNAVARAQNAIVEFVETLAAATPDPHAGLRRCEGGGFTGRLYALHQDHTGAPVPVIETDKGELVAVYSGGFRFTDILEKPQ